MRAATVNLIDLITRAGGGFTDAEKSGPAVPSTPSTPSSCPQEGCSR
ncbi:hypothetical protein [Aeromicrobium fastidiosum]|nr:hypothetical protein [Aeromicrobium fastidiosum]MBP2389436.1 hypothetical protein [Aeromicrobium fastidiosum]